MTISDSSEAGSENNVSVGEEQSATKIAWSKLPIILAAIFSLSVIMGTGPGILLVNRPESILGIPLVYAWGILWYFVQVFVVIVASWTVWRSKKIAEDREARTPSGSEVEVSVQSEGESTR
ncbi:hypothetical protein AB1L42_01205 [Thalassoglobus sp. JC818]|uniref:hypothetical protein n=1 Tax=Thalassoglobus sp. JC818 TaxID=3232136 RepID=UPI003457D2A1